MPPPYSHLNSPPRLTLTLTLAFGRVSAPCKLPVLANGSYTDTGYKSGLFVAHDFLVSYKCEPGFLAASETPVLCQFSQFTPAPPQCQLGLLNTVSTGEGAMAWGRRRIPTPDSSDGPWFCQVRPKEMRTAYGYSMMFSLHPPITSKTPFARRTSGSEC